MAKVTWLGHAKPDDPIYKTGPVIGGIRFYSSKSAKPASKKKVPPKATRKVSPKAG